MQLKGAIKGLTIIFGLIFLYTLSFTVVTKIQEKKAYNKAQELVYPKDEQTGEALPVSEQVQKAIDEAMTKRHLDQNQAMSFVANEIEKGYLDSLKVNNVTVYNLGFAKFNYHEAKENEINLGLDLKGGMNVTLEISVKEIIATLAGEKANEPEFQQALQLASERHLKSEGNFVTLFGQAFEEVNPGKSLAPYFLYSFKDTKDFNINSSNSDVLKFLRVECDKAFDNSFKILEKRISQFGVSQPVIQKIGNSGRILVELPGVKDTQRVRELLKKTAKLEFYETYTYEELYSYFAQVNAVLAEQNNAKKALSEANEPEVTEPTPADNTDSDQASLIEQLEEKENETNLVADDANNPLFTLLRDPGYAKSACVGYALEKDTAKINKMFAEAASFVQTPPKMKLAWSAKPEIKPQYGDALYFDLVALKMSKDDKCALDGGVVTNARQDFEDGKVAVELQMDSEGAKAWKQITGSNIGRQIAIVLDNLVYSYPVVNGEIPFGRSSISGGDMQIDEAKDLANILEAGKMDAPAIILEEQTIGPSLGKESVRKGLLSMVFAFFLVLVYMVFFYKKGGLVADIALIVNVFFLFGVLAAFHFVLTLPGIAGVVLTLGMAVDSNVIIFERIKEEIRGGKGLRLAIESGYKNAYSAIIDGNATTLITGIVLIALGTGPVRSFAITLCVGILTSLFTSIFISRLIFTRMLDKNKEISFTTKLTENFLKDTHFDFINFRKTAYIIACVMIVISIGSLCFKGLNRGIDFTGGRNYIVSFDKDVKVEEVRQVLTNVGIDGWSTPEVKTFGDNGQAVKITTKYKINDDNPNVDIEIQGILYNNLKSLFNQDIDEKQFSSEDETIGIKSTQKVGATIASDVTRKSIWAIIASLALMFVYIVIRFRRWQYALSSLAALTHDTIIMLGMYSLFFNILPFTMEVDQAFIAAVLTIIGYSINATVVIFDRVRENTTLHPKATWRDNINNAVNSTLTRSFNTSGSTFVVLLAIFFFGGDTIRGFIFALLVGILAGTFSSVFLSSPIAFNLLKGDKKDKAIAEAAEKNKKK